MTGTQAQRYYHKAKSLLIEHTILSLGEYLIYPMIIFNLYGLINEGRKFENGISALNCLFFIYSMIMDAFYMKFYVIWLVARVVFATYNKYDELLQPMLEEWKRFHWKYTKIS